MGRGDAKVLRGGMRIRPLQPTDLRCHEEGCGAGPGEPCAGFRLLSHRSRVDECAELGAEGWEWQEVDPRDPGAKRHETRCP